MTTDRDMERARETLDATYDEMPLFTRAVTKAQETAAANIIAAALAAERAPLEARLAELAKLLAKSRWALRYLLKGLSLDDAPRRAAIDRARETVRRWDAGEPVRSAADDVASTAISRDEWQRACSAWFKRTQVVERELERLRDEHAYRGQLLDELRVALEDFVTPEDRTLAQVTTRLVMELDQLRARLAEVERERDGALACVEVAELQTQGAAEAYAQIDTLRTEVERLHAGHRASNAEIERLTSLAGARGAEVEQLKAELTRRSQIIERLKCGDAVAVADAEERGARWGMEAAATTLENSGRRFAARLVRELSAADVVRAAREREAAERVEPDPPIDWHAEHEAAACDRVEHDERLRLLARAELVRVLPIENDRRVRTLVEKHVRELAGSTLYTCGESVRDRIEMAREGPPIDAAELSGTRLVSGVEALLRWLLS